MANVDAYFAAADKESRSEALRDKSRGFGHALGRVLKGAGGAAGPLPRREDAKSPFFRALESIDGRIVYSVNY